jgi:hypothetical protein
MKGIALCIWRSEWFANEKVDMKGVFDWAMQTSVLRLPAEASQ